MSRTALGWTTLVLAVAGAVAMGAPELFGGDPASVATLGGAFVRTAAILGAVWLALPDLRRMPSRLWLPLAVVTAVVIARPRLVLVALPLAVLLLFGGRRLIPPSQTHAAGQETAGRDRGGRDRGGRDRGHRDTGHRDTGGQDAGDQDEGASG